MTQKAVKPLTHIPWYGDVPSHWKQMRLKDAVDGCVNGFWGDEAVGDGSDTQVIRVADFQRNERRVAEGPTFRAIKPEQRAGRALEAGDLLIEKSGGGELQPVGMVVQYEGEAGAVCSNFVARMRPREGVAGRYLCFLHAHLYERSVTTLSIKQSTGIQNLDSAAYLGEACFLPPTEEQIAIASYLDVETARIDALIGGKQALIELLGELRNSFASEALEKGLDPNGPMRESGVQWLGPVPSHWSVKRLKHVLHGIEQGWSPQCDSRPAEPGEWGVLKAGACNGGRFRVEENKALLEETRPDPSIEVKPGDLLMSRASGSIDLVGSVAYVDAVPPGLMLSDKIFRLRVDHALHNSPQWLALLFNTQTQRRQIASFVRGSEGLARNIASTDVKELWIGVPPPAEQLKIVSFVQRKTDQIDELVKHVTRELELLRELRSATITDAVLGRIDVRPIVQNKKELEAA